MKLQIKKIDLSGVKDFLFLKGERIGLGICACIGVLLLCIGLMKAGGASTPYADNFKKIKNNLEAQIPSANPSNFPDIKPPDPGPTWRLVETAFDQTALMAVPDLKDDFRQNPAILSAMDDQKHLQADILHGGYFAYLLQKDQVYAFNPGDKTTDKFVKLMKPMRGVLITAVFPMKEEFLEYMKRLRHPTMDALIMAKADNPTPRGVIVYRYEIKADNSKGDAQLVYGVADDKTNVAGYIETFFREAWIDKDNPKIFEKEHLVPGLMTPLPLLANIEYRKPEIQDVKLDEAALADAKKQSVKTQPQPAKSGRFNFVQPKAANTGNAAPEKLGFVPISKAPEKLKERFQGKVDYFDPFAGENPQGGTSPGITVGSRTVGKAPPVQEIYNAVVRFIDVDLQPGKKYQYEFAIRMANPNFNKIKEVASDSMAKFSELQSTFAHSPIITIPEEFYYYAVDQREQPQGLASRPEPQDLKAASSDATVPYGLWNTAVQLHRWVEKSTSGEWSIADWAIAERLLVRRGDTIGRHEVRVEVPVYNKERDDFEIGFVPHEGKRKTPARFESGMPLSFIRDPAAPPPLLVDFTGGWKNNVTVGKTPIKRDECAVEMLVLSQDGKLSVRNSRIDTDDRDRQARWQNWARTISQLRRAAAEGMPKN